MPHHGRAPKERGFSRRHSALPWSMRQPQPVRRGARAQQARGAAPPRQRAQARPRLLDARQPVWRWRKQLAMLGGGRSLVVVGPRFRDVAAWGRQEALGGGGASVPRPGGGRSLMVVGASIVPECGGLGGLGGGRSLVVVGPQCLGCGGLRGWGVGRWRELCGVEASRLSSWRVGRLGGQSGSAVVGPQCLGCNGLGGWEVGAWRKLCGGGTSRLSSGFWGGLEPRVVWWWWGLRAWGVAACKGREARLD